MDKNDLYGFVHSSMTASGGSTLGLIDVEILNWERFNPKRDQKTYTWLRLDNDAWASQDLYGLTPTEKFVWIVLLSLASKTNAAKISVDVDFVAHNLGIKADTVSQAIEMICARHLATARGRARPHTTPTYERTNVRTNDIAQIKKPKTAAAPDGFAEFYSSYPRKVGKTAAMKAWHRVVSEPGFLLADLLAAREKYRAYCAAQGTEPKFIKHPATFLAGWRDCLDPDFGKSESFGGKPVLIRGPDWTQAAKDVRDHLHTGFSIRDELARLLDKIGRDRLLQFPLDEFRQSGRVPGMLKAAFEGRAS